MSNPILPKFEVVKQWAELVCLEFSNQVELEKSKCLPFAPHMENLKTLPQIAKLQVGFISYVVMPLWGAVAELFPKAQYCCDNMTKHKERWVELGNEETEKPKEEGVEEDSEVSDGNENPEEDDAETS